jgi:hypothetical protein
MRLYIRNIENEKDNATGEPKVSYIFCEDISEAAFLFTKHIAERELALMDGRLGSITIDGTRMHCSDFRIEQRSENEFVVSCEVPVSSFV